MLGYCILSKYYTCDFDESIGENYSSLNLFRDLEVLTLL